MLREKEVDTFNLIKATFKKQIKSKYLVVCKGNSWNTGIITLTIESNLCTENFAESLVLFFNYTYT